MAWLRFLLYFLAIAFTTWMLTRLEVAYPGSLRFEVFVTDADGLGTSEYSPVEIIQSLILVFCGFMFAWVAWHYPLQRPIAFPFGGLALAFLIRELDYFLDRFTVDNLSQVLIGVAGAFVIAYTYRQRRRLNIALARIWPSPGLTLLFAGAIVLFAFVRLVGYEPLWQSVLGDDYRRLAKLAIEELIELLGYFLWMIGTIEYCYQARSLAVREPQPAAVRRRQTLLGRRS